VYITKSFRCHDIRLSILNYIFYLYLIIPKPKLKNYPVLRGKHLEGVLTTPMSQKSAVT
jgi:hypothetical protein